MDENDLKKIRYFCMKDGELYSCCTDATNMEEAWDACDGVGGDQVLALTGDNADFIASQF